MCNEAGQIELWPIDKLVPYARKNDAAVDRSVPRSAFDGEEKANGAPPLLEPPVIGALMRDDF